MKKFLLAIIVVLLSCVMCEAAQPKTHTNRDRDVNRPVIRRYYTPYYYNPYPYYYNYSPYYYPGPIFVPWYDVYGPWNIFPRY